MTALTIKEQIFYISEMLAGKILPDSVFLSFFTGIHENQPFFLMHFLEIGHKKTCMGENQLSECQKIVRYYGRGKFFQTNDHELFCVAEEPAGDCNGEEAVRDLAFQIIEEMKNKYGITLVCGISKRTENTECLCEAEREADTALSHCFYTGGYSVNFFNGTTLFQDRMAAVRLQTTIRDELAKVDIKKPEQFFPVLEELNRMVSGTSLRKEFVIGLYLNVLYHALSVLEQNSGEQVMEAENLIRQITEASTLEQVHSSACSIISVLLMTENAAGSETVLIQQIKDYIHNNIASPLSLEDIAAHVYMTPSYLSQMFRSKTGEKLRTYITAERIKKAKTYLSHDKTIHEAARLTGFMSDSYFIQCFKNATNYTPKEFIRNHHLDCC